MGSEALLISFCPALVLGSISVPSYAVRGTNAAGAGAGAATGAATGAASGSSNAAAEEDGDAEESSTLNQIIVLKFPSGQDAADNELSFIKAIELGKPHEVRHD